MKIALGTDHAGFHLKETIKKYLLNSGYEVYDFGAHDDKSSDYPDYCRPAAESVARCQCDLGIVFGGSGNGEAMVANKVQGIRCGLCWNVESARLTKEHNNANMISIGARMVEEGEAIEIVRTWLISQFQGGRHLLRIKKIESVSQ
ncbi:ribose 5-phosphate isomerase B [Desulfosediminicola sp.]|uniref:ribose 5-phosphate isomerase B n=1 Tax=Desulfosediminicola sp. TaxID=2886825 RepID=UPI003AF2C0A3